ncbi:MAG: ROK family protein [Acidiferrobacterales bacterium]|jgi:fructokinase|nr:ROK family protein [Acidiferrobacterales bacterium]
MSYRIGIDLGGTKTEAIVMNEAGEILSRERRPTPVADGYDAILNNIADLVFTLEQPIGSKAHVGIGHPGAVSVRTGLLKNSNTVCMNGMPVKADLERLLDRPVRMANDANCFALSEAIDGAGRDANVVFGVIMGTGVGGGIVFHQKLHQGLQHIAGEWGHNILEPDGPLCFCGKHGCIENFLSGPGLLHAYRKAGGNQGDDTKTIVAKAANGDALAEETMQLFLDRFGHAMSIVVNILDPDIIVLGGGMSNLERLYTEGRDALARWVFNDELLTRVVRNVHGDSAGVRGAAWLWPARGEND